MIVYWTWTGFLEDCIIMASHSWRLLLCPREYWTLLFHISLPSIFCKKILPGDLTNLEFNLIKTYSIPYLPAELRFILSALFCIQMIRSELVPLHCSRGFAYYQNKWGTSFVYPTSFLTNFKLRQERVGSTGVLKIFAKRLSSLCVDFKVIYGNVTIGKQLGAQIVQNDLWPMMVPRMRGQDKMMMG